MPSTGSRATSSDASRSSSTTASTAASAFRSARWTVSMTPAPSGSSTGRGAIPTSRPSRRGPAPRRCVLPPGAEAPGVSGPGRGTRQGQHDAYRQAAAVARSRLHPSAEAGAQLIDDPQAEPGAAAPLPEAGVAAEGQRCLLRRETGSPVVDAHLELGAEAAGLDVDGCPALRVAQGVLHQIGDDAPQFGGIHPGDLD